MGYDLGEKKGEDPFSPINTRSRNMEGSAIDAYDTWSAHGETHYITYEICLGLEPLTA